jgi:MerR family transcriptional regulator, light-induced transcriptional regulator
MTVKLNHQQVSAAILGQRLEIASALVEREFARHPELEQRYGKISREKSLQDAGYHLSFLVQALALNNQAMFVDYVAWAKVMLSQRKVLASDLAFHLECLGEVLQERLPAEASTQAVEFIAAAVRAMPEMPEDMPTFLHHGEPLSPLAHQYFETLRRGDRRLASTLVLAAVATGTSVKDIYLHVFQPAQYEIGRLWQTNRITVAEEHYCTAATQLIMSQLYPHLFATAKNGLTLVATCVASDLHEIGVRMVADFFEMDGWDTFYLGASMPHDSIIATVVQRRADVLAVSATISYHVEAVRDLITAVRQHSAPGKVKILAGGYPFNLDPDLWRKVGADGSASDAQQAITLANQLMKEGPE